MPRGEQSTAADGAAARNDYLGAVNAWESSYLQAVQAARAQVQAAGGPNAATADAQLALLEQSVTDEATQLRAAAIALAVIGAGVAALVVTRRRRAA